MIPRSASGLIGLGIVAIVAFFFGGIFFSGSSGSAGDREENHLHESSASSKETIWTCSMHPHIQLPKSGACPICGMDLIPLDTDDGEALDPRQLKMSAAARAIARVESTPVVRQSANRETRMVGRLAYDETNLAYITAWVPGRLDRLYADYTGITVNRGDHMVYLYSPELLAAQEELIQALAASIALRNVKGSLGTTSLATVAAARDKLRLFGLSPKQIEEIENSGKASDHLTINAPAGGVVVHKNAKEGMYVKTGTRIYTIADLSKLWVFFEAYETDLIWLRYGQNITFTSTAYPGETFEGKVTFIDPVLDPKTRTVKVRGLVDNSDGRLKPDMFVSGVVMSRLNEAGEVVDESLAGKYIGPMHPEIVKDGPGDCDICGMSLVPAESLPFAVGAAEGGLAPLVIPASAPLITGRRSVVYVEMPEDEESIYEGRVVTLGPRVGDFYIVREGLAEGELVVVNGAFKIDSELQIRAKPSMMMPKGGGGPVAHNHGGAVAGRETTSEDHSEHQTEATTAETITVEARRALTPIYDAYFKVQEALAADDFSTALAASGSGLKSAINSVDMSLFTESTHMTWMEFATKLNKQSDLSGQSIDMVAARINFEALSEVVIELEQTFGHVGEGEFYLTFCPMAFGRGAYWMQANDNINNSYYGAAMLKCGTVKETFRSKEGDK